MFGHLCRLRKTGDIRLLHGSQTPWRASNVMGNANFPVGLSGVQGELSSILAAAVIGLPAGSFPFGGLPSNAAVAWLVARQIMRVNNS